MIFDNIEFPGPILIFDKSKLNEALTEILELGFSPLNLITDKKDILFQEAIMCNPGQNIDCIIIPYRYLITFLA